MLSLQSRSINGTNKTNSSSNKGWTTGEETAFICLDIIAIVCHLCGLYLLWSLRARRQAKTRHALIANLSVCVIIVVTTEIIKMGVNHILSEAYMKRKFIGPYINFQYALDVSVYISTLFSITINQLLQVVLTLRYPLYITFRRVKIFLLTIWTFSVCFCVTLTIWNKCRVLLSYLVPASDVLFVIFFILANIFIFHRFKMSRNPPTYCRQPSGNLRRISAWNAFKKSHFVSSFMLGLSYLICMAFPGIAASIFHVILDQPNIPRAFDATLIVLTKVSWIVEVCIYVLVDADVRQHLHRKRRVHQIHIENSQRH